MTRENESLTLEPKLVVVFDICSSTSILEDLKQTDNIHKWRNLLITLKENLVASHLAQLDHQAQGVVNGSFTAEGLADIGVQGNEICTRVVAQRPHYGPAAFPAVGVLAAPH